MSDSQLQSPLNYLIDMDGVLVHGSTPIPGANEFLQRLRDKGRRFMVLTNNPTYTPRDLSARLDRIGMSVPPNSIYTSAMATAAFMHRQLPRRQRLCAGRCGPVGSTARCGLHPDRPRAGLRGGRGNDRPQLRAG